MTTFDTLLDRVPVERITTEARQVHFGRTLLTLLAGLFWLVGWSVGKAFTAVWLALAFVAVAVRIGWSDARPTSPRT
jgi:hypothetical protein